MGQEFPWLTLEEFCRVCAEIEPEPVVAPLEKGCKNWPLMRNTGDYGAAKIIDRGKVPAHRLSLELELGRPIKPGMLALHSCDNKSCIEPSHLREGTHTDNVRDRASRMPWTWTWTTQASHIDLSYLREGIENVRYREDRVLSMPRIRTTSASHVLPFFSPQAYEFSIATQCTERPFTTVESMPAPAKV